MLMEEVFKVGVKLIKGYEQSFIGSRLFFFYVTKQQQQTKNKQGQKIKLSLIQGFLCT